MYVSVHVVLWQGSIVLTKYACAPKVFQQPPCLHIGATWIVWANELSKVTSGQGHPCAHVVAAVGTEYLSPHKICMLRPYPSM